MTLLSGQPRLGRAQVGAAKGVARVAAGVEPFARATRQPGVLIAPFEIRLERLHEPGQPRVPVILITKEDPLEVGQRLGHRLRCHLTVDDRDDHLVQCERLP